MIHFEAAIEKSLWYYLARPLLPLRVRRKCVRSARGRRKSVPRRKRSQRMDAWPQCEYSADGRRATQPSLYRLCTKYEIPYLPDRTTCIVEAVKRDVPNWGFAIWPSCSPLS